MGEKFLWFGPTAHSEQNTEPGFRAQPERRAGSGAAVEERTNGRSRALSAAVTAHGVGSSGTQGRTAGLQGKLGLLRARQQARAGERAAHLGPLL